MTTYRTFDGDMVDAICKTNYPNTPLAQALDVVFEANPTLAAEGAILPRGLVIELPEIIEVEVEPTIRLWD